MNVETGIRDLRQWVCWRSEERGGKPTKVPYSPTTGACARSDDPETWGTLAAAREAVRERGYDGLGFVFTASDPFCGVDLDRCLDPETGEVEPWALDIVEELDSYTEISPSVTGLHIIVHARLPEGGNRKGKIEMYDRGRFFTVTGRHLPGTPHLIEERLTQVEALHAHLFRTHEERAPSTNGTAASTNDLSDEEILRRATSAANGERFAALWRGDRSGYASDSEADLALCSMLAFWTGPDEDRIASLVARSGLAREKWNREGYRRRTIARAIEGAEFYKPAENVADPSRNGHHLDHALTTPESNPSPQILPEAAEFPVSTDRIPFSVPLTMRALV